MRSIAAVALATSLLVSNAFAANVSPLAAGHPAGVKQAQMGNQTIFIVFGAALAIGGIALAASGGSNNAVTPATTTSATTTTTTTTTTTG